MAIFAALDVYRDGVPRSAALNMAIDEALLETATGPTIRFYRWDHPALSFGYFGKLQDLTEFAGRDLVRRWTGGGIVLHGDDLTYSLAIPASHFAVAKWPMSIYESVHQALSDALAESGQTAHLSSVAVVSDRRNQPNPPVRDRRYNENACFANPVRADVMLNGQKIAGAAQRRTKRGLLQQGSIQNVNLSADFEMQFARALSEDSNVETLDRDLLARADEIAAQKYGTKAWLMRH